MDELDIRVTVEGNTAWVRPIGEFDFACWPGWEPVVLQVPLLGVARVTVDLRHLWFCDVAGVGQIAVAYRRWRAGGLKVTIEGAGPAVRRVFQLTGYGHLLTAAGGS